MASSAVSTAMVELSLRELRTLIEWRDIITWNDIEGYDDVLDTDAQLIAKLNKVIRSLDEEVREKFRGVRDGTVRPRLMNMRKIRRDMGKP